MEAERGVWAVRRNGEQSGLSGAMWETERTSWAVTLLPCIPSLLGGVKAMEENPWAGKSCCNREWSKAKQHQSVKLMTGAEPWE